MSSPAGQSSWPPALKAFVNATFAACTPLNKPEVEKELKELIFRAHQSGTIWQIDWPNIKLKTLAGPSGKKRKLQANNVTAGVSYVAPTAAAAGPGTFAELDRREKRARRFEAEKAAHFANAPSSSGPSFANRLNGYGSGSGYNTPEPEAVYDPNVIDWDRETIVGTSQKLEKPFLRLTTVPDPATIRPLPVLRAQFEQIKTKWRKEEATYAYVCDQLKSIRQDLTVQRIKNEFTVAVYEIHARIALEKGDMGEFNQCQGQLKTLYAHGIPGHPLEFISYRILYLLFSRNRAELNSTLVALTPEQRADADIQHALAVRQSLSQGNYTKFFRLFDSAPKMGPYLMDHFVERERVAALVTMTKAYQQLTLSFIFEQLSFNSTEDTHTFLAERDAALYKSAPAQTETIPYGQRVLDCKAAHPLLVASLSKFIKIDIKGQI